MGDISHQAKKKKKKKKKKKMVFLIPYINSKPKIILYRKNLSFRDTFF
jgi:hypothetical protein